MSKIQAADPEVKHFEARDGVRLAWREIGAGDPVILIHGLFSNALTNWLRYGHAVCIAAAGFRVILPDLRGHGESAAPHAPDFYPPDILADDAIDLIAHLGLSEGGFDLGGYSLGGRTTLRAMVRGVRPRRAVVAGMGIEGMRRTSRRADFFRKVLTGIGTHERGSPEWMAEAFLKTTGGDAAALLPLLDSFVDTDEAELATIGAETLLLCGVDDKDNGAASDLADILPNARFKEIPGNHMSAVLQPELGIEIRDFLAA